MNKQRTIILVLKQSETFTLKDVDLLVFHICKKWKSEIKPRIICLYDKATQVYDLGHYELHPLTNNCPGTWARMQLYSPEIEQYRPFLYLDLDTVVVNTVENIFDLVKDEKDFITIHDFWRPTMLATPVVWFPANSEKIKKVWDSWKKRGNIFGFRMDDFLKKVIIPDEYWQDLTNSIVDFKPKGINKGLLQVIPDNTNLICFHGKPRIRDCKIDWVKNYVNELK
jgi:hypothetical protein